MSIENLRRLVGDCDSASFGRGQQDVLEPEYHRAGKINVDQFATTFHPSDFGILENIAQGLLWQVYSGPSGHFKKPVDTPRAANQIGSLVVCLSSAFEGGKLNVEHHGQRVEFDWAAKSKDAIQWAAFYSDCKHEVETITQGNRITLTYNLYTTEPVGGVIPSPTSIVDPKTLPVHAPPCPQRSRPRPLLQLLKSLNIDVEDLPVLEHHGQYCGKNTEVGLTGKPVNRKRFYIGQDDESGIEVLIRFLMNGKKLVRPSYKDMMPRLISPADCEDIDRRWKTLLMARQVRGMGDAFGVAEHKNLAVKEDSLYKGSDSQIGVLRHAYKVTDSGQDEDLDDVAEGVWPFQYLPGITWVTEPEHEEMAFRQIAYGNEASMGTRRKKSRCPGERPACSYCQRLGQTCEYAGDEEPDHASKMEQRIEGIEGRLEALIELFSNPNSSTTSLVPSQLRSESDVDNSSTLSLLDVPPIVSQHEQTTETKQSSTIAHTALQLFYTYCNFQPLPLFHHKSLPDSSASRDPELLLTMQALGLRFTPNGIADPEVDKQITEWTESSRRMIMARIAEGSVELSTLQALCLLAYIDYTAGRAMRAGTNLRLATFFLENLQFGNTEITVLEYERDERLLLRWSIYMLGNLFGEPRRRLTHSLHTRLANREDLGLAVCAIQLGEVWGLAQSYAASPVAADSLPPWAPQSDYSQITFRHLDFESIAPLRYRHHRTGLDESYATDLQQRRDFWGHCLFFQLAFHAVPCLLNHPLLLSMRLRNFRHTMPQSFLQHSYEQIILHAGWILHFIDLIEAKGYEVSDPTLGQCVVIVATICLQHSFVEEVYFRGKAESGYEKCLRFLQRMALRWPNIKQQVDNLGKLRSSISPGDTQESRQAWLANAQLLRDILVAPPPKLPAADIFGPGLAEDCIVHTDSSTLDPEFGLIGSAGLSGHRTVVKGLATYYPPEHVLNSTPPDISALLGQPGTGLPATATDVFLQPQDYGRFIDNWLDLPV
ncbi:Zn(II)2Cys6 transcription factor [Aspergillus undulatus]|uniref:Zn(II)2Cys6 transcription factor n=1 Tax=Aspergillus undulatus TaxID=1810928 RepID=UPI003CCE1605